MNIPPSRWNWLGRLAVGGLLAVTTATLCGAAGRWHWILELSCHFTFQLVVAAAVLLAVLMLLRRWRYSLLAVGVLALLACRGVPGPGRGIAGDDTGREPLRLAFANVLTFATTFQPLIDYIEAEDVDVLMLAEFSPQAEAKLAPLLRKFPYQHSIVRPDSFGIGVFSRHELSRVRTEHLDGKVPTLFADLLVNSETSLQLVVTHPPPPITWGQAARRNLQLRELARRAAASPLPVVIAGDFNCTPWSPHFHDLLKTGKLRDTRGSRQPTWPANLPWLVQIPIDHILVSDEIVVTRREVGPAYASDHLPVLAEFTVARE